MMALMITRDYETFDSDFDRPASSAQMASTTAAAEPAENESCEYEDLLAAETDTFPIKGVVAPGCVHPFADSHAPFAAVCVVGLAMNTILLTILTRPSYRQTYMLHLMVLTLIDISIHVSYILMFTSQSVALMFRVEWLYKTSVYLTRYLYFYANVGCPL